MTETRSYTADAIAQIIDRAVFYDWAHKNRDFVMGHAAFAGCSGPKADEVWAQIVRMRADWVQPEGKVLDFRR